MKASSGPGAGGESGTPRPSACEEERFDAVVGFSCLDLFGKWLVEKIGYIFLNILLYVNSGFFRY